MSNRQAHYSWDIQRLPLHRVKTRVMPVYISIYIAPCSVQSQDIAKSHLPTWIAIILGLRINPTGDPMPYSSLIKSVLLSFLAIALVSIVYLLAI